MKKTLSALLMMFAVAFTVMLASGTTSKALATWNANLSQTEATEQSVELQWDAYPGADHYEIFFSNDNSSWTEMDWSTSTSKVIYGLTSGSYVRVIAYSGSYFSDSKTPLAESESMDVITRPKKVEEVKQTGATTNSITMSWKAQPGVTEYRIYRYDSYNNYVAFGMSKTNSYTIKGLNASVKASYFVLAVNTNSKGQSAISTSFDTYYMRTTPAKVPYISLSNYWTALGYADFKWNAVNNADGYQFQIQDYKGKTLMTQDTVYSNASVNPLKKDVFTKVRARAYILVNNKRVYGAWSPYDYNATCSSIRVIRSANRKKITLKWKKIKGASGYAVYVSTKSGSGYKKLKTLGAKKTTYTFTKFKGKKLSKNKRYYIRLKYLTKSGKKTITSHIQGQGDI